MDEELVEKKPAPKKEKPVKKGVVVNGNLNMRRRATVDSDVACVLECGTEVIILSDKDLAFYKIAVDGLEGYCMKEFIKIIKEVK